MKKLNVIRKSSLFKLLAIVIIVLKCYPSTYCLMPGSYFICSNFFFFKYTSKIESQP